MPAGRRHGGYTLVEIVLAISVAALLAAVVAPRFGSIGPARAHAAARRLAQDIRFAQRLAVAKHAPCGVLVVGATSYRIFEGNTETSAEDPLTRQRIDVDLTQTSPGVTAGPVGASVSFDALGRPAAAVTFTIGGRTVAVAAETGAVTR